MKKLLKRILNHPEIQQNPPVLVDIGASNKIHPKWKLIANHSICIAFDADERDFQFVEKEQNNFKKLYVFNRVVTDQNVDKIPFYLTRSPYCSGLLKPDFDKLKPYLFSNLFEVENTVILKATHLQFALNNLGIKTVDWFKSDSQGTDLRLFKSLDEDIRKNILVAEFEPGIIDAYKGEDKLFSVLEFFNNKDFWLSDIEIKGTPRIPYEKFHSEFRGNIFKKLLKESIKTAPGWGEMTFMNSFESNSLTLREYLLGWIFAMIEKHFSFAYIIAEQGQEKFNADLFNEMKSYSKMKMKQEVYRLKFLPSAAKYFKKNFLR
jgi:hypothetical protein